MPYGHARRKRVKWFRFRTDFDCALLVSIQCTNLNELHVNVRFGQRSFIFQGSQKSHNFTLIYHYL